MVKAN